MAKTCLCEGCNRPVFSHGYCSLFYHQAMRTDQKWLDSLAKQNAKQFTPIAKVSKKKLAENDGNLFKATRIKPLGKSRAADYRIYIPIRDKFLDEHEECEAKLPGCTWKSVDVHHPAGKIGKLLYDVNNMLAVCRLCHDWCEDHPEKAKEMEFSKSRLAKYNDENN